MIRMVILILVLLWVISFLSPQLTTRRYMLTSFHWGSVFTSKITDKNQFDRKYGHLYDVTGFVSRTTGDAISVFYLKQFGPFWIVSSVGTGP
ncbi:hypothetical protein [Paenibacillus glycanilyticus]|uniref:Uncharacterized protein n=1 Tax=Paenibacillus glycanilyticus TaxID=126569 RepID=A0ABQ6G919_9BACL|nr:hypothetical protein [Paenibacillus glycanilyticus]GLX66755.1 hypothetical protein MU1_10990 [Paenibacillus glycanilyticus]